MCRPIDYSSLIHSSRAADLTGGGEVFSIRSLLDDLARAAFRRRQAAARAVRITELRDAVESMGRELARRERIRRMARRVDMALRVDALLEYAGRDALGRPFVMLGDSPLRAGAREVYGLGWEHRLDRCGVGALIECGT